MKKMLLACALGLLGAGTVLAQTESADSFPSRSIRIVVPFAAGGPADNIVRFIGQHLNDKWKQPVVVESRVGAGGSIGAAEVARARPDGYTLVLLVTGHMILPAISKNVPYDITTDFTPVSIVSRSPKLFVTAASSPVTSFPDLLAKVKQDPAKFGNYGTSGIGSEAHLITELVNQLAGTHFTHVPYKGGVGPLPDLMDGRLPVGVLDIGSVLPHLKSGKLKALASSGANRSAVLPDVPRISETLPAFESSGWYGIAGPRGIPPAITAKLQQEIAAALKSPEAKAKFADNLGWELPATTPQQMQQELTTQTRKWAELVQKVGLKAD